MRTPRYIQGSINDANFAYLTDVIRHQNRKIAKLAKCVETLGEGKNEIAEDIASLTNDVGDSLDITYENFTKASTAVEALNYAVEDIRETVKDLPDRVTDLEEKYSEVEKSLVTIDESITNITGTVEDLKAEMESGFEDVEEQIKEIVGFDPTEILAELKAVEEDNEATRKEVAELKELVEEAITFDPTEFEERLTAVEEAIETLNGDVTTIQASLTALDARLTECESDVDDIRETVNGYNDTISGIKLDMTDLVDKFDALETTVGSYDAIISELQETCSDLSESITTLQAEIAACNARIDELTPFDPSEIEAELNTLKETVEELGYTVGDYEDQIENAYNVAIAAQTSIDDLNSSWETFISYIDDEEEDLSNFYEWIEDDHAIYESYPEYLTELPYNSPRTLLHYLQDLDTWGEEGDNAFDFLSGCLGWHNHLTVKNANEYAIMNISEVCEGGYAYYYCRQPMLMMVKDSHLTGESDRYWWGCYFCGDGDILALGEGKNVEYTMEFSTDQTILDTLPSCFSSGSYPKLIIFRNDEFTIKYIITMGNGCPYCSYNHDGTIYKDNTTFPIK